LEEIVLLITFSSDLFSDYGYWDGKEKKSFVSYQMLVSLDDGAVIGDSYTFSTIATLGESMHVKEDPEITAADFIIEVGQEVTAILK